MKDQLELGRIAAEHGMVIEGPNCLGCTNYVARVPLTFVETNMRPRPRARARSASPASRARSPRCWRPRCIRAASTSRPRFRPATRRPRASRTMSSGWSTTRTPTSSPCMSRACAAPRPSSPPRGARARPASRSIMLHPGKSNKAQESAATHTGAMAGDYQLMKAKLAREGVIFADTLEELADIAEIALRCKALPGANMVVLGESGALRGLAFDLAEDIGLDLLHLDDDNSPVLRAHPARLRAGFEPDRHHRAGPVGAGDLHQGADRAARGRAGRLRGRLDHPVGSDHLEDQVPARSSRCWKTGPFPSRWSSPASTRAPTCPRNTSRGCTRSASRGSRAPSAPIAPSPAWPISPSAT